MDKPEAVLSGKVVFVVADDESRDDNDALFLKTQFVKHVLEEACNVREVRITERVGSRRYDHGHLSHDLRRVKTSDVVVALHGWHKCPAARMELSTAWDHDLPVLYFDHTDGTFEWFPGQDD